MTRLLLVILLSLATPAVGIAMPTPELFDSGVPRGQVDVLVKLYRDAQDRLKRIVLEPPGGTEAAREFRAAWAAQQIQQIQRMLASLDQAAANWIGENLSHAMIDGINRARTQAIEAGVSVPEAPAGGSFALIDHGTLRVFARDIHADLSNAGKAMGERASYLLRATAQNHLSERDINTILAGGVIEGRPLETIRTLREEFRRVAGDEIAIKTKNGNVMNFEVGYYASMVARTRTREATVHARHERLQQLNLDLVSIVGLVSKNFCTAYLGQVFSLSGNSTKYPPLKSLPSGGPPFHPNCSKSTRPFVEELASEKQLNMAEGDDDQAKMLNIDPATAQRRFKDLQLQQQVRERYATTAKALFGKVSG